MVSKCSHWLIPSESIWSAAGPFSAMSLSNGNTLCFYSQFLFLFSTKSPLNRWWYNFPGFLASHVTLTDSWKIAILTTHHTSVAPEYQHKQADDHAGANCAQKCERKDISELLPCRLETLVKDGIHSQPWQIRRIFEYFQAIRELSKVKPRSFQPSL